MKREDLSGKAAKLKTESSTLLGQAQETERTLQGTEKETDNWNVGTVWQAFIEPEFSQFSKALQHMFSQKRLVLLQWAMLCWVFLTAKGWESEFPTSAMLYTFAVLLSSKPLALNLFCSANSHSMLRGNTSCVRVHAGAATAPVQQWDGSSVQNSYRAFTLLQLLVQPLKT